MKIVANKVVLIIIFTLCAKLGLAQEYPSIVFVENSNDKVTTFTTVGIGVKKGDTEVNAIRSLFYTLFYVGVDGVNDGEPLVSKDDDSYISNFLNNKISMYSLNREEVTKPEKNLVKVYEATYRVKVPMANLIKELTQNGLREPAIDKTKLANVDEIESVVLPTIIVVPFKKSGESYDAILQNDYDKRMAVSKLQDGFESRNITTVDVLGKIDAVKRRMEYDANNADSNDKQLLLNSGADVYVTVDLLKDIQSSGSRVSLIMKAYETSTGSILATKDGYSKKYNTTAIERLCAFAVEDNITDFLNDISKNFNKQVTSSKKVALVVSIAGNSMMTMSDQVGPKNYRLSDVIRQWVRANSDQGKYHLQGSVEESIIFDYVMIPLTDVDGLAMDAAQFGFLLQSYLVEQQDVDCTSRIDGNTIYITIE